MIEIAAGEHQTLLHPFLKAVISTDGRRGPFVRCRERVRVGLFSKLGLYARCREVNGVDGAIRICPHIPIWLCIVTREVLRLQVTSP